MKIDAEIYERVAKATGTEYDVDYPKERQDEWMEEWVRIYDNKVIEAMLQDLLCEIDYIEEKFEDYKEYVKENYKPKRVAEQVGISDKEFI